MLESRCLKNNSVNELHKLTHQFLTYFYLLIYKIEYLIVNFQFIHFYFFWNLLLIELLKEFWLFHFFVHLIYMIYYPILTVFLDNFGLEFFCKTFIFYFEISYPGLFLYFFIKIKEKEFFWYFKYKKKVSIFYIWMFAIQVLETILHYKKRLVVF